VEEMTEISKTHLERVAKIDCFLEMEIGITGGEEDGVDNSELWCSSPRRSTNLELSGAVLNLDNEGPV
jgi:fructose/tagatose bisphosphate aldolase